MPLPGGEAGPRTHPDPVVVGRTPARWRHEPLRPCEHGTRPPPQLRVRWSGRDSSPVLSTGHSLTTAYPAARRSDGMAAATAGVMGIAIRSTAPGESTTDSWLDALVKLIPGESIVAFA